VIHTDKQLHFNQTKGYITELNDSETFCNITLEVGHEKRRMANFVLKKELFDALCKEFKTGDFICLKFFPSSRFKHERWYTMNNVLEYSK